MKLTKRLLAMALAGVMLLTILTGCGGGKTGDRLVEEYMASYYHDFPDYKDKPFTNDVPEIKTVAEKFDPSLLAPNGIGFDTNVLPAGPNSDLHTSLRPLKEALAKYSSCISVYLYAMEVPDGMSELTQVTLLLHHSFPYIAHNDTSSVKFGSFKCASTLVKKAGKQYRLVVLIQVPTAS